MSRNAEKIRTGIKALSMKRNELFSATVVAGTTDETAGTTTVLPTNANDPEQALERTMLNAVGNNSNGWILLPADGSDVVVGTVDGSGETMLLRPGTLVKAKLKIEGSTCTTDANSIVTANGDTSISVDANKIVLKQGNTAITISSENYSIRNQANSLKDILDELIEAIQAMTVTTGTGPSGTPINTTMFDNVKTKIDNLLS